MDWVSAIFVYFIIWWVVLFTTLPLGVKKQQNPVPGSDPGAPEHPQLVRKILLTSIISAVILAAFWYFVSQNGMEYFRDALPNP